MVLPPTAFLPPIRREPSYQTVSASLTKLRDIFASSKEKDDRKEDQIEQLEELRRDYHERQYTLSWLNKLLDSQLAWLVDDDYDERVETMASQPGPSNLPNENTEAMLHPSQAVTNLLELAANLSESLVSGLSIGQGLHDDEPMERTFHFPFDFDRPNAVHKPQTRGASLGDSEREGNETLESYSSSSLTVTLVDAPLPPSESDRKRNEAGADGTSASLEASTAVGVQTWAAAIVLSDLLVREPHVIHSDLVDTTSRKSLRVAELGAGTGLVGIVCGKVLRQRQQQQYTPIRNEEIVDVSSSTHHEVVLTDYHARVLANLQRNVDANFSMDKPQDQPDEETGKQPGPQLNIRVSSVDWSHYLEPSAAAALGTPRYDLLLAADVVYAKEHPVWLYAAMSALLERSPGARAHVINARREQGRFGEWGLVARTDAAFGPPWPDAGDDRNERSTLPGEPRLRVLSRKELPRRKGLGRPDESGHVWWMLGWK